MQKTYFDDEGNELEIDLPTKREVCWRCEGNGFHLTPSIGEHAYSMEEFYDSFYDSFSEEEDRAEYFRRGGIYDVVCMTCNGKNVIDVVDEDACDRRLTSDHVFKEGYEAWERSEEARRRAEAEQAAERRMECHLENRGW